MRAFFRRNPPRQPSLRIVIVGAGISGLCLAIRLKQAGYRHVTVLEKAGEVGGTWLHNSYPNAGCDIPSYLYSFSFARHYPWSTKYARQPEILAYLKHCADHFGVRSQIRFGTAVKTATFDESAGTWSIETDRGDTLDADLFVSAVGQLNRPHIPAVEGLESFQGEHWHSARWNHDVDLRGKCVAVVGNGASAVQLLPEVAKAARQTYVFQKSPNWIHPLRNPGYPRWKQAALRIPLATSLYRLALYLQCEWRIAAFREHSWLNREYARWLRRQMRRLIPTEQWAQLIPDYAPGCKRILLSSDYLQTLQRDNVQLINEPVERLHRDAIASASAVHPVDVVIFATGFKSSAFHQPMQIRGRGGQTLDDAWSDRPKALYGLATAGFPNLFLLYGPNTNLGHNSIIFMVECQVEYILRCLNQLQRRQKQIVEVREEALARFDRETQASLQSSVWSGDCQSWYKSQTGSIVNNWSGSATSYWLKTRRPQWADLRFSNPPQQVCYPTSTTTGTRQGNESAVAV